MLDHGRWRGQQLVDARWIEESSVRVDRGVRFWAGRAFDYGRLWWITSDGAGDILTASGALGQWIFVSPRHQLVVVSTADDDSRFTAAVEFLLSHVLPSVRD